MTWGETDFSCMSRSMQVALAELDAEGQLSLGPGAPAPIRASVSSTIKAKVRLPVLTFCTKKGTPGCPGNGHRVWLLSYTLSWGAVPGSCAEAVAFCQLLSLLYLCPRLRFGDAGNLVPSATALGFHSQTFCTL